MNNQTDPWIEGNAPQSNTNKEFNLLKNMPALLRILGTAAVLIAMYSFLVKGWESHNDIFRYLLMLGHTGVLAAIGLASGHWLKESKGARLLLSLSLISVPANFAILGAFIFSQTTMMSIDSYPHYVAWTVDSMNSALFTTAGAMFVLVPVTLLGFTVLARSMSKKLSFLFLLSSASLLLPVRDPQLIGLLVLGLAAFTFIFSRRTSQNQTAAKTQEGMIALGLQILPLAVLMGRSIWLYSADMFLLTVLSLTIFFLLRQISLLLIVDSKLRTILETLSLLPAAAVSFTLSSVLHSISYLSIEINLPVASLVFASMVYEISCRCSKNSHIYRLFAVTGLLIGTLGNLAFFTSLLTALMCIAIGLGLIIIGYKAQQRGLFSGGIILMTLGMIQQMVELFQHFDLGSWASLAIIGIASIVLASTIESRGGKLKTRLDALRVKFTHWDK